MKDINFNDETIPAPKDGHEVASYYQWYRDNRQMKRNQFREHNTKGKVYACALGAAFGAHDEYQCNVDIVPDWLTSATPTVFDFMSKHLQWSDAVYGKGGLVDRSADLTPEARAKFWADLEKEVAARVRCNVPEYSHYEGVYPFTRAIESPTTRSRAAWTVVEVGEQLLTEAGV